MDIPNPLGSLAIFKGAEGPRDRKLGEASLCTIWPLLFCRTHCSSFLTCLPQSISRPTLARLRTFARALLLGALHWSAHCWLPQLPSDRGLPVGSRCPQPSPPGYFLSSPSFFCSQRLSEFAIILVLSIGSLILCPSIGA